MTEGASAAKGHLGEVIQNVHFAATNDLNSIDDNLRERVLKIVADRDVRSSQQEGDEGRNVGAPLMASGEV